MAIVFVSAQNKQTAFFWGIGVLLCLFLLTVFLIVFLPDFLHMPSEAPSGMTYTSPNTNVDLNILDSPVLKNLEPFNVIETAFSYTVTNQSGKKVTGTISAISREEAQRQLEESGFKIESLQEAVTGRTNPFVSY